MHLCTDWSCVLYWLWSINWAGWAQAIAATAVVVLAICGPRRERQQARLEAKADTLNARIRVLEVLDFTCKRLHMSGELLERQLSSDRPEVDQVRRIRERLVIDEMACSSISLPDLQDSHMLKAVIDAIQEARLLAIATEKFLHAIRSGDGGLMDGLSQRATLLDAKANAMTACDHLTLTLSDLETVSSRELKQEKAELVAVQKKIR